MFTHFHAAQHPVYADVLAQLRAGQKTSHWMWFIFPQLRALGRSPLAQRFGLVSLDQARDYMADPVLGYRLRQCTAIVNALENRTVEEIFSNPDDRKFRSSMTLFAEATPEFPEFKAALARYFNGEKDGLTLALL